MKKIYRLKEIVELTSLSKSTIYRMINAGIFPASIALSQRAVAWLVSDVDAWLDSLGK
jgi:prophage regulatory protein